MPAARAPPAGKNDAAPKNKSGLGPNDCLLCGQSGHRARECPNRGNGGSGGDRKRAFNSFVGMLTEDVSEQAGPPRDESQEEHPEDPDFVAFNMSECEGYALLDGGASLSVGGVEMLERVRDQLTTTDRGMQVNTKASLGFTFAGGDRAQAPSRVSFPVSTVSDEEISVYVLDRPSPVLLGVDMLKKLRLRIDYDTNEVYSHKLKRTIPTKVLPSGHIAIKLTPEGASDE